MHSASPYLRQHAHNPVYWHPWGAEALAAAREENKPIHLSVGYSSCYWCHVMERNVFENVSIAAQMNQNFINIKVDREEHPQIDDLYMVARQLMTHEGGWPNTVFLTPDLQPFYAGGSYAPDESYGKTSFPRLLEWLHYAWTTQEQDVRQTAGRIVEQMRPFLVHAPTGTPLSGGEDALFETLKQHHDARAGGFFQAPKFPHESYLQFLLGYHEATGDAEALDMVTRSLRRMAAGGVYDQVGCGFHRYAVDKEWYVPHFEKMLYNQALLARVYTDAARATGNPYFADTARGILEFVSGPMTSGNGTFYSAIDAETDGVEGAYYAWKAEELKSLLTGEEAAFLTSLYALADIPAFSGHKHVDGQALILRKPLDIAAGERQVPYVQLAAMCARVMNTLLAARNKRPVPRLDDKVITGWNGLMIGAFAHAGTAFDRPGYTARARAAAGFLLEHAIDNEGRLKRVLSGNRAYLDATLEDYAFLIHGLLALCRGKPDKELLDAAISLAARAEELFADGKNPANGYFVTEAAADDLPIRIKHGDDSAVPNANAMMAHNLIDLFAATQYRGYLDKAASLTAFFLSVPGVQLEQAGMLHAAVRLKTLAAGKTREAPPRTFDAGAYQRKNNAAPKDVVAAGASLFPPDPRPAGLCEVLVTLDIKEGWHINAHRVNQPFLIPTQLDAQGKDIALVGVDYPDPLQRAGHGDGETLLVYEGRVTLSARLRLPPAETRPAITVLLRFQPCREGLCHAPRDIALTI